jgi:hypothetical protein
MADDDGEISRSLAPLVICGYIGATSCLHLSASKQTDSLRTALRHLPKLYGITSNHRTHRTLSSVVDVIVENAISLQLS